MPMRLAQRSDLPRILELLADDPIGKHRGYSDAPSPEHERAFERIHEDRNNHLMVYEDRGELLGTLQLTFIPYLTYNGKTRAQVEAVRVASSARGRGIGKIMIEWVVERAKAEGCHMVQLTTDKRRADAARFYESLGFVASHEGYKLTV